MQPTEDDYEWFEDNPDRQYRLRPQTPWEARSGPPAPSTGQTLWCVLRRGDSTVKVAVGPANDEPPDDDDTLRVLFNVVTRANH